MDAASSTTDLRIGCPLPRQYFPPLRRERADAFRHEEPASEPMTQAEEIDMLRRAVADLTERVRTLEARPAVPVYAPLNPVPSLPYPPVMPYVAPYTAPWFHVGPATSGDPMPMQPLTTCTAQESHWLAQSRGEI